MDGFQRNHGKHISQVMYQEDDSHESLASLRELSVPFFPSLLIFLGLLLIPFFSFFSFVVSSYLATAVWILLMVLLCFPLLFLHFGQQSMPLFNKLPPKPLLISIVMILLSYFLSCIFSIQPIGSVFGLFSADPASGGFLLLLLLLSLVAACTRWSQQALDNLALIWSVLATIVTPIILISALQTNSLSVGIRSDILLWLSIGFGFALWQTIAPQLTGWRQSLGLVQLLIIVQVFILGAPREVSLVIAGIVLLFMQDLSKTPLGKLAVFLTASLTLLPLAPFSPLPATLLPGWVWGSASFLQIRNNIQFLSPKELLIGLGPAMTSGASLWATVSQQGSEGFRLLYEQGVIGILCTYIGFGIALRYIVAKLNLSVLAIPGTLLLCLSLLLNGNSQFLATLWVMIGIAISVSATNTNQRSLQQTRNELIFRPAFLVILGSASIVTSCLLYASWNYKHLATALQENPQLHPVQVQQMQTMLKFAPFDPLITRDAATLFYAHALQEKPTGEEQEAAYLSIMQDAVDSAKKAAELCPICPSTLEVLAVLYEKVPFETTQKSAKSVRLQLANLEQRFPTPIVKE